MTLNDLKNEVLALTFETELESYSAFIFAVNRALLEIHSEKEISETAEIYKKKLAAKDCYAHASHKSGEDKIIELEAKTFSLTVCGIGTLLFTDGGITEEINFSGISTVIKKIITTGKAFLTFTGEYDYEIYNLASFDSKSSDDESDVPLFSEFVTFDMRKINPAFLGFSSFIKNEKGVAVPGVKTDGSLILVPRDYEGKIIVNYKRLPRKVRDGEIDTELDISSECEHLLALRCAAYLLLDENEGLAQYYLSLYKSGISAVKIYGGKEASQNFCDVLGWA